MKAICTFIITFVVMFVVFAFCKILNGGVVDNKYATSSAIAAALVAFGVACGVSSCN